MAVLLDTDHFSMLQRQRLGDGGLLQTRLDRLLVDEVKVCIVSFQEQIQGWLAFINRARKPEEILRGFRDLKGILVDYAAFDVVAFDQLAMDEFLRLKQHRIRIGTSDLRIAAIAKASRVKLLSRNLRDFRQVPGLDVEDWTV